MRKKYLLLLALLLASLSLAVSPAVFASARHKSKGKEERFAAKRRSFKQRVKVRSRLITYTCPMHHDVHLKSPGDCPKCGMELEAEKRGR